MIIHNDVSRSEVTSLIIQKFPLEKRRESVKRSPLPKAEALDLPMTDEILLEKHPDKNDISNESSAAFGSRRDDEFNRICAVARTNYL